MENIHKNKWSFKTLILTKSYDKGYYFLLPDCYYRCDFLLWKLKFYWFLGVFSYGSSSISTIFVLWWSTLNEYITREWQIYISFQSNDLDS